MSNMFYFTVMSLVISRLNCLRQADIRLKGNSLKILFFSQILIRFKWSQYFQFLNPETFSYHKNFCQSFFGAVQINQFVKDDEFGKSVKIIFLFMKIFEGWNGVRFLGVFPMVIYMVSFLSSVFQDIVSRIICIPVDK